MIYHPINQHELAMIKMILEREGVNYYINNESVSCLIGAAFLSHVMVRSDQAEHVREILKEELGLIL